ncbi:MAG: hypothetical protein D6813_06660 [Calditrichaeota bacterium]|nr:MAG: hypothetical protein D6813_06660 [Calditrichota bacterium]
MKSKIKISKRYPLFWILYCICLVPALRAQSTDSTAVARQDTSKAAPVKEFILEEIHIEAVVEKPNVAILPSRMKPELDRLEFISRSFEPELREEPEKILLLESDLQAIKNVKLIEQILNKVRSKQPSKKK